MFLISQLFVVVSQLPDALTRTYPGLLTNHTQDPGKRLDSNLHC